VRRFTILGVMGLVLVSAVGLAALRGANDYWAGGLLTVTPLLFGLALIGALCGRPEKKAGRLGFVVLGGGYFALAFLGLSDANLNKLPTSQALSYAHQKVAGPGPIVMTTRIMPSGSTYVPASVLSRPVPAPLNLPPVVLPDGTTSVGDVDADGMLDLFVTNSVSWGAVLPGAANYDAFHVVGHCLVSLMTGGVGALVARRVASRARGAAEGAGPGPVAG